MSWFTYYIVVQYRSSKLWKQWTCEVHGYGTNVVRKGKTSCWKFLKLMQGITFTVPKTVYVLFIPISFEYSYVGEINRYGYKCKLVHVSVIRVLKQREGSHKTVSTYFLSTNCYLRSNVDKSLQQCPNILSDMSFTVLIVSIQIESRNKFPVFPEIHCEACIRQWRSRGDNV